MAPSDVPHPCGAHGTGEAGKYLAWHMAHARHRTAVVERQWIGGSCPNINCLPSKNEIWSAKVADLVHHAAALGTVTSPGSVDMARVRQRKRDMVEGQITLHLEPYQASGAGLIMGTGRLVAPHTLEVRLNDGGTRVLAGDRVFLNVGTHATIPDLPGLVAAKPLTHIEVLELDRLPAHLIVLGGGYVSLEFAQAYRRFWSRVTVVEHGPQLAGREDPDVADAILQVFGADGIEVLLAAETLRVQGRSGERVRLSVRAPQGEQTIAGSDLLVAVGRTPNTAGIGPETAGVALDARGYILETAIQKVRAPEDGWNSCDPEQVSLAYGIQSRWRNRPEFVVGRARGRRFRRQPTRPRPRKHGPWVRTNPCRELTHRICRRGTWPWWGACLSLAC